MKKTIIILISILCLKATAQTLTISYISKENEAKDLSLSTVKNDLILQADRSLYYTTNPDTSQFKYKDRIMNVVQIEDMWVVNLDDNTSEFIDNYIFYKHYGQDTIVYNQSQYFKFKQSIIGEPLSGMMNWKIIKGKDSVILGYNCQKATTNFRGRDYNAYFSSKLAPRGGPWKFDGLPGLILYVCSQDKYFEIKPYQIILNQQKPPITNPYKDKKPEQIISWKDFKQINKEMSKKTLKLMYDNADAGDEFGFKIESIEDLELGITMIKK